MLTWLRRAILVLAAFAFAGSMPQLALADRTLKTTIKSIAHEPFRITECAASVKYGGGGSHFDVSYSNASNKSIKAIKVRFVLEDDFDTPLRDQIGDDGDGIDTTASGHASWYFASDPQTTTEAVCQAYAAQFADGTVWESRPGAAGPSSGDEEPKTR